MYKFDKTFVFIILLLKNFLACEPRLFSSITIFFDCQRGERLPTCLDLFHWSRLNNPIRFKDYNIIIYKTVYWLHRGNKSWHQTSATSLSFLGNRNLHNFASLCINEDLTVCERLLSEYCCIPSFPEMPVVIITNLLIPMYLNDLWSSENSIEVVQV